MAAKTQAYERDATDEAIEFLCKRNIHRCLWLPATDKHEKLRVTYGVSSNFDDTNLPVLLFLGPLFGTRWHIIEFDKAAQENGVRLVCTDRPGMGGSTPVPLEQRVQVWVETVPILLKALNVDHVSLMTHSAGTVYLLNTLWHYRDILEPKAPYVAFMAPWVHNSHSQALLMNLASTLPAGAVNSLDTVQRFIVSKINPAIGWSGGLISSLTDVLQIKPSDAESNEALQAKKYGVTVEVAKQISTHSAKWHLAEDTSACSQDALLLLKKTGPGNWGVCEDYKTYVGQFCAREKDRRSAGRDLPKLRIRAFFAESDALIGKLGQDYFKQCWEQDEVSEVAGFESVELPGTNHDSLITDLEKGAVPTIFDDVKKASSSSA